VGGWASSQATSNLPTTPVFDGTAIYGADDKGTVYSWWWTGGIVPGWPVPPSSGILTVSPPVLLEGAGAGVLVVYSDGRVKIIGSGGGAQQQVIGSLLEGAPTPPLAPVIDQRNLGTSPPSGVAYVAASNGWIYAWQIAAAPKTASTTVWPRPGHDSCNSRNSNTSNTVCP
jgi:hypothetical protein